MPVIAPVTIAIGDTVSNTVAAPGAFDTYEFVSVGNENIYIDFQALNDSLVTQLKDPNGVVVCLIQRMGAA